MKIGPRTLKTAIAVLLSLLLFETLQWDSPFYAAIASVIGMQNTIENSYQVSINRMIGTIIGGIVGFVLSVLLGHSALICALGIIITITICQKLSKPNAVVISCIVLIAILTNLKDQPAHLYAIHRVFETSIGLLIAIGVNRFVVLEKIGWFKE